MHPPNTPHDLAIAIDGPAASGKSAAGEQVARRLGIRFLDTGAMYRAITLAALQRGVSPHDADALTALATAAEISLERNANADRLLLNGEDITDAIRSDAVDANVSAVSAVSGVRRALVTRQRAIAAQGSLVMAGRDIGSVVLPNADLKIFLTASDETRARRRAEQAEQHGAPDAPGYPGYQAEYRKVLCALRRRDKIDSEREDSPLRRAADAVEIRSDDMTLNQVVAKILALTRDSVKRRAELRQ